MNPFYWNPSHSLPERDGPRSLCTSPHLALCVLRRASSALDTHVGEEFCGMEGHPQADYARERMPQPGESSAGSPRMRPPLTSTLLILRLPCRASSLCRSSLAHVFSPAGVGCGVSRFPGVLIQCFSLRLCFSATIVCSTQYLAGAALLGDPARYARAGAERSKAQNRPRFWPGLMVVQSQA
jgi:hypothetical protein